VKTPPISMMPPTASTPVKVVYEYGQVRFIEGGPDVGYVLQQHRTMITIMSDGKTKEESSWVDVPLVEPIKREAPR
jgi:hypothetical protein